MSINDYPTRKIALIKILEFIYSSNVFNYQYEEKKLDVTEMWFYRKTIRIP